MHMADALISPAVGGTLWAATAGLIGYSSKKVKQDMDDRRVPLMGVLGAFIFAAQMINFTIPGTGSSGHLGGGMILAVLLGPSAAFLTLSSVLTVQAFFFADGGLLALGCNIFNLGFFPCFVAYPLIYKPLVKNKSSERRVALGAILSAVAGLQLGALGVVLETHLSGVSDLPFGAFLLMMQPIHLAIGIVEGLATAAVVVFVRKANPGILELTAPAGPARTSSFKKVLAGLLVAAAVTGGLVSWFASTYPDGLEWSISRSADKETLEPPKISLYAWLAALQEKTALLPDYGFGTTVKEGAKDAWPAVDPGTSLSGLLGGFLTLAVLVLIALVLKRGRRNHVPH
ncbi:MAG: energy-coupling factor ABC transporter permease [Deltaproteobacteria bacterium]